VKVDQQIN